MSIVEWEFRSHRESSARRVGPPHVGEQNGEDNGEDNGGQNARMTAPAGAVIQAHSRRIACVEAASGM